MERFPLHLDCRKHQGKYWELLQPFIFISAHLGPIEAKRGFWTDLASVPWFARWYVSRDGDHTKPAVIHDWLYDVVSGFDFPGISRLDADRVFYEALKVRGVRPGLALVLFLSVRVGGCFSFRRQPKCE